MKKPEINSWSLTTNENGIKMATLPQSKMIEIVEYLNSVNENEIKRAFAMEVIEKWKNDRSTYPSGDAQTMISIFIGSVQSLLPKEEEVDWSKATKDNLFPNSNQPDTKTESDEVKAEVDGEIVTVIHNTGYVAWVKQPNQEMGWLEHSKNLKPIQSLGQKARKKAEEMFIKAWNGKTEKKCDGSILAHMEYCIEAIAEGIKFDPKTL